MFTIVRDDAGRRSDTRFGGDVSLATRNSMPTGPLLGPVVPALPARLAFFLADRAVRHGSPLRFILRCDGCLSDIGRSSSTGDLRETSEEPLNLHKNLHKDFWIRENVL